MAGNKSDKIGSSHWKEIFKAGRNLRHDQKLNRSENSGNLPRSHSKPLCWLRLKSGFLEDGPSVPLAIPPGKFDPKWHFKGNHTWD